MHLVYVHQQKNTKYVSSSRIIHIFIPLKKVPNTVYFFISEGIFDQISIALNFIILAPKFERAFGRANCRVLICLVLYG